MPDKSFNKFIETYKCSWVTLMKGKLVQVKHFYLHIRMTQSFFVHNRLTHYRYLNACPYPQCVWASSYLWSAPYTYALLAKMILLLVIILIVVVITCIIHTYNSNNPKLLFSGEFAILVVFTSECIYDITLLLS